MKSRSPFREFYILRLRESQEQICSVYKIASTSCAHECDLILLINACTQNLSIFALHPIYPLFIRWCSKDKTVLAFDPIDKEIPKVKIIDRECEDFEALRKKYTTLIQSIRMVSCKGKNVWAPQNKIWSTASVGTDNKGRILFIHVRSPYSTHDLINMLMQIPIKLERAMYVEGGADAQLYINTGKEEHEFIGSYSTGLREHDQNTFSHPIPNVLGLIRVKQQ